MSETHVDDATDAPTDSQTPTEPIPIESAEHFQSVVGEYPTVLVDFYADWCGPCQMIAPTMEKLAAETDTAVAKVDVDRLTSLASRHGVQGVPTMLLYADGEIAERLVGARDETTLRPLIDEHQSAN